MLFSLVLKVPRAFIHTKLPKDKIGSVSQRNLSVPQHVDFTVIKNPHCNKETTLFIDMSHPGILHS